MKKSTSPPWPPGLEEHIRERLRLHEAGEMLRKRQQGYGRPIITTTLGDQRVVVCGKRVTASTRWRFFLDFLLDNLKFVLGTEWGAKASGEQPDHTLFRWLRLFQAAKLAAGPGNPIQSKGHVTALARLAYSLYLIEHNDKPSKSLIKRLRRSEEFAPACYEAIVASAFALAGASIEGAEDVKGGGSRPEFFARFADGKRYSVEAKRKNAWKSEINPANEEFKRELAAWLRGRLHEASKKNLGNPVYWLELGIGEGFTVEAINELRILILAAVRGAETITVKGQPPKPAYVVVTNNVDFSNDEATVQYQFAYMVGFLMDDFREVSVDWETAMDLHDRHRPIRRVLECTAEVQQVPTSFDGLPDELLDKMGKPLPIPKVGQRIDYRGPDGDARHGVISEITSGGDTAWAIIRDDEAKQSHIVTIPLTAQEAHAARKFGDAVFGKPQGPVENSDDLYQIYDGMLRMFGGFDHAGLLAQLAGHHQLEEYRKLGVEALRIRVAREFTKHLAALNEPGHG